MKVDLSIILPTLNEVESVPVTLSYLEKLLEAVDFELIVVDDDSTDGTWQKVLEISRNNARVRLIRRVHRKGLSTAIMEGFMAAKGNKLLVADADLQHDLGIIPRMLEASNDYDLVVGSRYLDQSRISGWSSNRQSLSIYGTRFACSIIKNKVTDPLSGFFLIDAAKLHGMVPVLRSKGFKILFEILVKHPDLTVKEIPYEFKNRQFGQSKLTGAVIWDFAETLLTRNLLGNWNLILLKSILGGLSGIVVNLLMFVILRKSGLDFINSLVLSVHVALVWNYLIKAYLYAIKPGMKQLLDYYGTHFFGTVAILVSGFFISQLQYTEWMTVIISILLGSGWNFFGNHIFDFSDKN
ncbi:MAG: glycosyltransferase [SAR324 cluster bacterium]|nr:glycosyltransferase [SAR324 cluster bacterium]